MSVKTDVDKVKTFVDNCVKSLENDNYAYVCDGYIGDNSGGKYDNVIQRHADKIVKKLVSLGYIYTTNHGFGCKDWSFTKEFDL